MTVPTHRRAGPSARASQAGFVLVTGLLFLVILTLLGLALFRGTGLMDRISSNTRDKQRSFEAAQSALQYGEWWLSQAGNGGVGTPCTTGLVDANTVGNIHVCLNALPASYGTNAQEMTNGFKYLPPNMTVAAGGSGGGMVSTAAGSDVNYYKPPTFYLENIGLSNDGKSQLYQVSAFGYGGRMETGTAVRSIYQVTSSVKCLDCP